MKIIKSNGITEGEKLVAELCEKSFLKLWSYANLYKEPGKELCDNFILFGNTIILISEKTKTPFEYDQFYLVATNSYRGNGGGELFTKGAGILHDQLASRIVLSTEKDLRHYLIDYISECGIVDARPLNQWHFVPEEWADEACRRDRKTVRSLLCCNNL